ncbi:hypothetical protein FRC17_006589, partial [Serendipita sp. 399]
MAAVPVKRPKILPSISDADPDKPTNQRFSPGPDGNTYVDLTFRSEPLGMSAENGFGFPKFEFGEKLGRDKRYTIARKLGWGMHSSTWLARDTADGKYVAVKALTGYMTDLSRKKAVWEAEALERLSAPPVSPHCVRLLDQFAIPGLGSAGEHLCFVMPVYGGDALAQFLANQQTPFALPLVKHILLHILRGLAHAHSHKIVHTDLKIDQFFSETTLTTEDIDKCVENDPPRRHPPEMSEDGIVRVAASQPLPMISNEEALKATYVLGDFGCAANAEFRQDHPITSPTLRPPEVFLSGPWGIEADIWAFGCLVFEMITGKSLFKHEPNAELGLDDTEHMLYQMIVYSGEDFPRDLLDQLPTADRYFNSECNLKSNPTIPETIIEFLFENHKVMSPLDNAKTANFMRRCLSLPPNARATAAELLEDP